MGLQQYRMLLAMLGYNLGSRGVAVCDFRQRERVTVFLINHCCTRLQAMLPDQAPSQPCSPTCSPPLATCATPGLSCDEDQRRCGQQPTPLVSSSHCLDTESQQDHLLDQPQAAPATAAVGALQGQKPENAPAGAGLDHRPGSVQHRTGSVVEVASAGTDVVQEPLVEASTGQALAEATVELMLGVLRECEEEGQLPTEMRRSRPKACKGLANLLIKLACPASLLTQCSAVFGFPFASHGNFGDYDMPA